MFSSSSTLFSMLSIWSLSYCSIYRTVSTTTQPIDFVSTLFTYPDVLSNVTFETLNQLLIDLWRPLHIGVTGPFRANSLFLTSYRRFLIENVLVWLSKTLVFPFFSESVGFLAVLAFIRDFSFFNEALFNFFKLEVEDDVYWRLDVLNHHVRVEWHDNLSLLLLLLRTYSFILHSYQVN